MKNQYYKTFPYDKYFAIADINMDLPLQINVMDSDWGVRDEQVESHFRIFLGYHRVEIIPETAYVELSLSLARNAPDTTTYNILPPSKYYNFPKQHLALNSVAQPNTEPSLTSALFVFRGLDCLAKFGIALRVRGLYILKRLAGPLIDLLNNKKTNWRDWSVATFLNYIAKETREEALIQFGRIGELCHCLAKANSIENSSP